MNGRTFVLSLLDLNSSPFRWSLHHRQVLRPIQLISMLVWAGAPEEQEEEEQVGREAASVQLVLGEEEGNQEPIDASKENQEQRNKWVVKHAVVTCSPT
jgi:hypothetical protein